MLFAPRGQAKMSAVVISLAAAPAFADSPAPAPQASGDAGTTSITLDTIEVISQELNAARLQIQPSLGASTYTFSPEALETIPQGENAPLNQVLLQMPGVAQDSFGQIHVRGEHANVQFRINGVQLPEGLSVFGQALEIPLCPQRLAAHWRPAGTIWISDGWRVGHPDQDRTHQSGHGRHHVWR